LITIFNLVESYTGGGDALLGPVEQARADLEAAHRKASGSEKVNEERPQPPAQAPSPVDDLIEDLIEQGEEPFTAEQLELCRSHRAEAVSALIELATDEYLQWEDSPGEGYAPIRAVQLLGELKAEEAIPTLIDITADAGIETIISDAALHALQEIGLPALEPVLTFMRYSRDVEAKIKLAEMVGAVGEGNEQAYEVLAAVWEETAWEDGKCLLAYPLAQTGGERAVPLIEAALEDPELDDLLDYNEVAYALEVLGRELPFKSVDLSALEEVLTRYILSEIGTPDRLMSVVESAPEEWRSDTDALAYAYAASERDKLNIMLAVQAIGLPPEVSTLLVSALLEAVERLAFDASTRGYPRWLNRTYASLAREFGPDLQLNLIGVLLALQCYLKEDYDIAEDPDRLLASARQIPDDEEEQRHLFARAGALILHGRSFWHLWPAETDPPLSKWLEGLIEFRSLLECVGQIPLRPSSEVEVEELQPMLVGALEELRGREPPSTVAGLLDALVAHKQDTLPQVERRRFAHRRAAIIPYLIHMIEDKQYWFEDGPGEGWPAILAVRLLGDLKASRGAPVLVSAVADSGPADIIHDAALFSLMAIGPPALEAVQTYFRYGRNIETKTSLAEVLGYIGRRDADTFGLLREVWELADWTQNRRMVALAFGILRDRRAVPLLQAALKDRDADALDLEYVGWALQQLGAAAPSAPPAKTLRLKTAMPHNPRLIYDEFNVPHHARYSPWGELLCPDCGEPMTLDEDGEWTHSSGRSDRRSGSRGRRRRKRKKKRR
ncbi:MAG: hypothetical protein DRI48_10065, partial [Chloroflexi bacterium]